MYPMTLYFIKIPGLSIKPIHLKLTLPLLAVWLIALLWSAHHNISNERNRLAFLAKGVRRVAEQNAAMIDPVAVARMNCAIPQGYRSSEPSCPIRAYTPAGVGICDFSAQCGWRHGTEGRRVGEVLRDALQDLRYLPYFTELYKERVLGPGGKDRVFTFRVEVQRRDVNGSFVQVGAIHVPSRENIGLFGMPVARYVQGAAELAQATGAWERGEPTEWITEANYQLFWPIKGERGTAALLALQVERERHSGLYTVGLVLMLSFWFIGIALFTAATSVLAGAAWLFNTLTIWGMGLILVVLVLLIWYRRHGGFGAISRQKREKTM